MNPSPYSHHHNQARWGNDLTKDEANGAGADLKNVLPKEEKLKICQSWTWREGLDCVTK